MDALFGAIDAAVEPLLGWHPVLVEYEIRAVSGGEDAQGQVLVRARRSIDPEDTQTAATGHGLSTNIIEASVEAYLAAIEKLLAGVVKPSPAESQATTGAWRKRQDPDASRTAGGAAAPAENSAR